MAVLVGSAGFYGLGHEAVFSAIPWEAAFVGLPGDFAIKALQALPVLLHVTAGIHFSKLNWHRWQQDNLDMLEEHFIFALIDLNYRVCPGHVLAAVAVPLSAVLLASPGHASDLAVLRDPADVFFIQALRFAACLGGLLHSALLLPPRTGRWLAGWRVVAVAAAAALHCRHLMVWKVFAPRFVFEAVGGVAGLAGLLAASAFAVRLRAAATAWL